MAGDLDTVLIVDDEESVRKTFREWLEGARLGCRVLSAADDESALRLANEHQIDLAILDWNLGTGMDGLRLLEDLAMFNPDVVAIMITGYAHQATPLEAMRKGVRDYLDKNQDLDRDTFLRAVQRQLDRIRPAKRQRRLNQGLAAFRAAVEKVLPLVQAAAALNDPVPLPAAVRQLFRFVTQLTAAGDGVLFVRSYHAHLNPPEVVRVYGVDGQPLSVEPAPFSKSVAGSVVSLQQPLVLDFAAAAGEFSLQPFERGRRTLLAAPINVAPGLQVVLELFDKQSGGAFGGTFTDADKRLVAAAAEFAGELLRLALAERQTHQVLFDAVAAALKASDAVSSALPPDTPRPEDAPPPAVLEQIRQGLSTSRDPALEPGETVQLAEAIRELAVRHGPAAVQHCLDLVKGVRRLLDEVAGLGETPP